MMTIDEEIRDKKLQYYINRVHQKHQLYDQIKLINMNISQVKKCCLLIIEK